MKSIILDFILRNNKSIIIIGPFPEPISGVSLANEVVRKVLLLHSYKVHIINTSFSEFDEQVGKFSFKKALFFLKLNLSIYKIFSSNIVYITPGQTFFGVLKYAAFILLSRVLGKELIVHIHGNHLRDAYDEMNKVKKRIIYFLVSKFHKGIVLSQSLKKNLTPFLDNSQIFSLPNFAEDYLLEENTEVNNELRIVFLSNLMIEKGILHLLEALHFLELKGIKYKAKIAGNIDKSTKDNFFVLLNRLSNTEYVGLVKGEEKKALLLWSNIFILPTFYKMEGQPISILEAMATKNVIITTDHAGIPDIFSSGVHGFYVDKKSSKSISETLEYLSVQKEEVKKIAENNKVYFLKNFTLSNFKKNLLEIIEK